MEFEHDVPEDLGPLQFVKLCKHHSLVDNAWFCDRITVQGPGDCVEAAFPCYRWVQGKGVLSLPEGTGERPLPGLGSGALGLGGAEGVAVRKIRGALKKVSAHQIKGGEGRKRRKVIKSQSYT